MIGRDDLPDAVEQSTGGVQGEPSPELPDQAAVTLPEVEGDGTPPDAGPIEPAGGIVQRPPHPGEAERSH